MKKVLLIVLMVLVVATAMLTGGGYYLLRGAPSWYSRRSKSSGNAAATLENKLVVYYDRMAAAHAWRLRHRSAGTNPASTRQDATAPTADPTLAPFEIQFTDEELNAFFDKWAGADNRREAKMDQYVQDPRILLQPGKMVLAATVRDLGAVVSIEITPQVDASGQLRISLSRAYAGMLPLPDSLWQSRREQIQKLLERNLERDQASAQISPDGVANGSASAAGMKELMLDALQNQPAAAVLFLPYDSSHPGRSAPVKLDALTLSDGGISMRVQEMDAGERAALLDRLRKPRGGPEGDSPADPAASHAAAPSSPVQ